MRRRTFLAGSLGALAPLAGRGSPASAAVADWPDRRLAAQLVLAGVDMGRLPDAVDWARRGVGGIVLFGEPPADLRRQLARVRAAARIRPFVASDEEGGRVQRLAEAIYPLPSAEWLGRNRRPYQVRRIARAYGRRMRELGVDVAFAPVADLGIPGYYIERLDRAFAERPAQVTAFVEAWQAGLRDARVVPVVKHWPGHGQASDTHVGLAATPPSSVLRTRDMVPFERAFRAGVPAVMVGHLLVPGLTKPRVPASLSTGALRFLRKHAGPATLIVTDSLSMGAIRTSLGLREDQAAVRALQAGADLALIIGDPRRSIATITDAIAAGRYPRARARASVARVLAVKRAFDR